MRNDRDDKYEGSENSEYHFSDDQYEADAGAAKSTSAGYDGVIEKSGKSKRLIISLVIFVVLIGVVYKLVAPSSSSQPATDIMPAQSSPSIAKQGNQSNLTTQTTQTTQTSVAPAQPVTSPPPQTPPSPAMQAPTAQQAMQPPAQPVTGPAPVDMQPGQPSTMPTQPGTAPSTPDMMQPDMNQGAAAQPQAPAGAPMSAGPSMPGVIPVQSAPPPVTVVNGASPDTQVIDSAGATMAADSRRVEAEIQAEYNKRLAEYQSENKMLQVQIQTLSSQVGLLESKMNQLVSSLNQQYQGGAQAGAQSPMSPMPTAVGMPAPAPVTVAPSPMEQASPPPRVPYNVTAIIPGRAWLRSNNGDTLTVAEGDQIKGVGRVSKIDPYDGVIIIEIPGGKTVSLSYGNGS